ncbi:MAG: hypothetical protein U9N34_03420, partial [Candidatus Cloacimonadota bacterium]|nr:hypothetical protein [Candidatus Cloacimonadota bacterium]
MKKIFSLLLVSVLISSAFAVGMQESLTNNSQDFTNEREEIIIYQQDFEDGLDGWTSVDGSAPDEEWTLSTEGAYEGNSWWMHDPVINGYHNHRYIVLDTPEITLPASNLDFTFKLDYAMEGIGGTGDYNGWDGFNVRISTDGGINWEVLEGTPEYSASSFYSFGSEFNEGPGIPAWGGESNGYVDVTFDLTDWANQDVMIRFAFASDPAVSTDDGNNPEWFGVRIDDINIANVFESDGEGAAGDAQLVSGYGVDPGGDFWSITEDTSAPSPTHAMACQNDAGSYDINLLNFLVSPSITLPETEDDIYADFMLRGSFNDTDTFPDVDYFGYEVSNDDGVTWNAMSNPTGDPNGTNYVYSSSVSEDETEWGSMIGAFSIDGTLPSEWGGSDVMFRIYFKSDNDTPDGIGLFVDDFKVYADFELPVPQSTSAMEVAGGVQVDWDAPIGGDTEIYTETDAAWVSFVNDGQPYAQKIINDTYDTVIITGVNFCLYNINETVTGTADIFVWADDGGLPGEVITSEEDIDGLVQMGYTFANLSEPVELAAGEIVYVGVGGFDTTDQGLLADETSTVMNSYANIDGAWNNFDAVYNGLNNVGVSASVIVPDPNAPSPDSYNVYHSEDATNFTMVGSVAGDITEYLHTTPITEAINYYQVTSVFGENESAASTTAQVYVLSETSGIIGYDDGTSEEPFNAGATHSCAVKFTPQIDPNFEEATLTTAQVYIAEPSTQAMIIRVWDDDEGLPNSQLVQLVYPAASFVQGWNNIEFPDGNQVSVSEGSF